MWVPSELTGARATRSRWGSAHDRQSRSAPTEVRTLRGGPPHDIVEAHRHTARAVPQRRRPPANSDGRVAMAHTRSAVSSSSEARQLVPPLGRLAAQKVRPQTQQLVMGVLSAWLRLSPLPQWDGPTCDETTADFVEWMFDRD